MSKYEPKYTGEESKLVNAVIEEMADAFETGELEAVDELLRFIPRVNLIQFLPEDDWSDFMTEKETREIYGDPDMEAQDPKFGKYKI